MPNENEIIITIEDKTGGSGDGKDDKEKKKKVPGSVPQLLSMWTDNDIVKEGISDLYRIGVEMINFSVANIGNFTGNYLQQRNTQATLGYVNKGISLSFRAAKNIATQGPILGAITTAIGVGFDIFEKAKQVHEMSIQNRIINQDIDMLRDRAGLNQLNDGGRGTLN